MHGVILHFSFIEVSPDHICRIVVEKIIFVGFYSPLYYRDPVIHHMSAWVDVVYEKSKSG